MLNRVVGVGLLAVGWGLPGLAQVVPDGTAATLVTTQANGTQLIGGGTARGTTLFHSFDRFSVGAAESVLFGSGNLYRTIVGRVTGGNQSRLDGTIGVEGSANLLLINPAGMTLGRDVRFNMTGSLLLSTATAKFADGTEFGVGTAVPALTVAVLPGIQWGPIAPTSTIAATGNIEKIDFPGDLSLVAGKIDVAGYAILDRGQLTLRALGDITIAGVDGSDNGLRATTLTIDAGGDLRVAGYVNLRRNILGSAGSVTIGETIAPRSVTVRGISTRNFNGDGGAISVTTTGEFRTTGAFSRSDGNTLSLLNQVIQPGDRVSVASEAQGKGGAIAIKAGSIVTSAAVISDSLGSGTGGAIVLTSAGALSVQGVIDAGASANGGGDGGSVTLVSGGDLLAGTIKTQGRSSGDIQLTAARTLSLLGPISTEALEVSGAVNLTGQSIELRQTQVTTAGRRGGSVTVTGNLLLDGSRIVTTAFGDDLARFGDVRVTGDLVAIGPLGASLNPATPVGITTRDLGNSARGGNLTVSGNQLSLTGASLTALNGGAIEIATQALAVTNGGIYQRSGNTAVTAGDLRIGADRVQLNQGAIEVSGASGDGANLRLTARSLSMAGGSSLLASAGYGGGIGSAQTLGAGLGGNLFLDLGELTATANGNNDLISRATNPGTSRGQTQVKTELLRDFALRSDASLQVDFGNSDGLNFRQLASNDVRGIPTKPPVGGPIEPPINPPIEPPIDPPVIPPVIPPVVATTARYSDRPVTTIAYDRGCDAARHWADRTGREAAPLPNLGAIATGLAAVDDSVGERTGLVREASGATIDAQGRTVLMPGLGGLQQAARRFRVNCEPLDPTVLP
jgi:filamentous hemagglutinin family protein